jgi:DegV family protein with EDD domain
MQIVMDGGGDLPIGWAEEFGINVVPINIHFKEKTFLQGLDLSDEEFYRLADLNREIPKTSQPSPQQFIDFYEKIAKPGEIILSIHISSKLSGTFNSAVLAAKELAGRVKILPYDSGTGSAALGLMCREARMMERAGATIQSIIDRLNFISKNHSIVLTLDNLDYAFRSGRVKALQAALASLLKVKPIAALREGTLVMVERVRTRQRALEMIIQMTAESMGKRKVNVAIVQARDLPAGLNLLQRVRDTLNCREIVMTDLSIGVAANLGPGTIGIVAYPVED